MQGSRSAASVQVKITATTSQYPHGGHHCCLLTLEAGVPPWGLLVKPVLSYLRYHLTPQAPSCTVSFSFRPASEVR